MRSMNLTSNYSSWKIHPGFSKCVQPKRNHQLPGARRADLCVCSAAYSSGLYEGQRTWHHRRGVGVGRSGLLCSKHQLSPWRVRSIDLEIRSNCFDAGKSLQWKPRSARCERSDWLIVMEECRKISEGLLGSFALILWHNAEINTQIFWNPIQLFLVKQNKKRAVLSEKTCWQPAFGCSSMADLS